MASESPQSPFVPYSFGRYELTQRLALGGMAEIFCARQAGAHGFEKLLVIKRILPHLANDPEFVSMFIDEAKLQGALQHPKNVQVYEFGEVDGVYFIALEFIDGLDTLGLLRACAHRRQRLPVRLAVHIAAEVLDALDYAHERRGPDGAPLGVVHRDVSPSNIFISRRGDVKLGDFGIAHAANDQRTSKTQAGTLKGKYGYMAPEQVVGGDIDGRTDEFAVGIVLAEMLMGRRLFTAANDLDVLLMVRDARLDRLDRHGADIPPPLRALLNKMLARDPAERFAKASEARDALSDFLFDARQRVSSADLGAFLESLGIANTPPVRHEESGMAMMGEDTRARRQAADQQRQAVLRASQEVQAQVPPPALMPAEVHIDLDLELDLGEPPFAVETAESPTPRGPALLAVVGDKPDISGSFPEVTAAHLFSGLATAPESGLLVLERDSVVKEIYLMNGTPEFVSSNVPSERFGEYLVQCGVISAGELSMALAILPRFAGKLGDTLVGLNLLRPLEVFRHLTRQVREKLIDVFTWDRGTYRFYRGRANEREAFPLGLDAYEIIGAAVAQLSLSAVRQRLNQIATARPRRVERGLPAPESFRVGAGPRELWQRLDGKRTVGDWMKRYEQPEQLLTLCRTLYLLIETDLAVLD